MAVCDCGLYVVCGRVFLLCCNCSLWSVVRCHDVLCTTVVVCSLSVSLYISLTDTLLST